MRTIKIILRVLALVGIAAAALVIRTFYIAGEFTPLTPHFSGECRQVSGVFSSEDITIDPASGLAFISSDDRRPLFRGQIGRQGAVVGYSLTSERPEPLILTTDFHEPFHPHGLGLWTAPDGGLSLFVVNHRPDGHFVEIFDFNGRKLVHRRSVRGPLMHSPNDVIPVGPNEFYVTNDHGSTSGLGRVMEDYLQLARSNVLYFDGNSFREAAGGLKYANGVNISPDGSTVYVAETLGRRIRVYDRDRAGGGLTLSRTVDLDTGVDNIEVDPSGALWIGAHPKLLTFVRYSKLPPLPHAEDYLAKPADPREWSPSQVLRVELGADGRSVVDEVYLGDGAALSGSSVGAVFGRKLLIGSVFDPRFLVCERP